MKNKIFTLACMATALTACDQIQPNDTEVLAYKMLLLKHLDEQKAQENPNYLADAHTLAQRDLSPDQKALHAYARRLNRQARHFVKQDNYYDAYKQVYRTGFPDELRADLLNHGLLKVRVTSRNVPVLIETNTHER